MVYYNADTSNNTCVERNTLVSQATIVFWSVSKGLRTDAL
jgi:hypothetical protein